MAKSEAERGPIGAWLRRERLHRGWQTAEEARINLVAAGVLNADKSTYAEWEAHTNGAVPPAYVLEKLKAFYRTEPAEAAGPEPVESLLVAALHEQAEWMRRYVEQTDQRIAALEAMLVAISAPGLEPEKLAGDQEWAARLRAASQLLRPDPAPDRA